MVLGIAYKKIIQALTYNVLKFACFNIVHILRLNNILRLSSFALVASMIIDLMLIAIRNQRHHIHQSTYLIRGVLRRFLSQNYIWVFLLNLTSDKTFSHIHQISHIDLMTMLALSTSLYLNLNIRLLF